MGCLIYIIGTVQIVFIILKLLNLIAWNWVSVFSPTIFFIILIAISIIKNKIDEWMEGY